MCIAVVKPADKTITKEVLRNCADNNKDGCGFAYINVDHNGVRRLKTKKSMVFDDFYEKYTKAVERNSESTFLVHFRIKTHGHIDLANCHPFMIDHEHVFIHNGTITGVRKDANLSDTRVFNEDMLRVLPKDWNRNSGMKTLIEDFIGFSKLAVLSLDGSHNIYNEHKGSWVDGVWYSNDSYKKRKPYTPKTETKPPFKGGGGSTKYWNGYNYSGNTSTTGGTSSFTADLAKITSKTKGKQRLTEFQSDSYIQCDCCGIYRKVDDMESYLQTNHIICFCPKCALQKDIWYYFDSEDLISIDAHLDWLNEQVQGQSPDLAIYEVADDWVNPWALPEDYEGYDEEYDEEEETEQELQDQLEYHEACEEAYQMMIQDQRVQEH